MARRGHNLQEYKFAAPYVAQTQSDFFDLTSGGVAEATTAASQSFHHHCSAIF
jgi:hypothetical protein